MTLLLIIFWGIAAAVSICDLVYGMLTGQPQYAAIGALLLLISLFGLRNTVKQSIKPYRAGIETLPLEKCNETDYYLVYDRDSAMSCIAKLWKTEDRSDAFMLFIILLYLNTAHPIYF